MEARQVIDALAALPRDWHRAGSVGRRVLDAIAEHAPGEIHCSAETGTGLTTLLLSHLSERHLVFARDDGALREGGSLQAVRTSPLLRAGRVEFIIGATQKTIVRHRFDSPLDFVLLDGPHAWPFPDLEYYAVYPHIRPGGLMVVDDIHIPTIQNMWKVLREDPMFEHIEVVRNTAFFRRTSAPTFDPLGDRWVDQPYNVSRFPVMSRRDKLRRRAARAARRMVPRQVRRVIRR